MDNRMTGHLMARSSVMSGSSRLALAALTVGVLSGCADNGSDQGDGGDCVTFLKFGGDTYFPEAARNLPFSETSIEAELPTCDDQGVNEGEVQQLTVFQLEGVDPSVALGQPAQSDAEAETIWIAIGDSPKHDVPDEVSDYLAR
jgi:hypothetical protein